MKEIANKAISIYFYEALIRNKSLNHQCLGQFLKCIFFLLELCCPTEVEPAFTRQPIAGLLCSDWQGLGKAFSDQVLK